MTGFLKKLMFRALARYKNQYGIAMIVFLIVPLSGVCIDIYVPSLPAISANFHTSKAMSQLTVTSYLLGLGLVQLFAGSIADSYGRLKPFRYAMMVFLAVTWIMPWSQCIEQLICLRLLQGAALALVVVPMRAVILDLFEGLELQKMMTYMTMSWSIGPIIAPAIGGYLQFYLGWQTVFISLGLYSLLIFILSQRLVVETSQQFHPFRIKDILRRYRSMISNPDYLVCIFTGGLIYSLITLFGISGSFFIQNKLHQTTVQFGHISLALGCAWFLGSFSNRFMLSLTLTKKAYIGFGSMALISMLMLLAHQQCPLSLYAVLIPMR